MLLNELKTKVEKHEEVVVRMLEKWAEQIGDKPFFFYGEDDKHYSFKKFNQMTNSIAHHLQSLGVRKGDRVSLFLRNPLVTSLMMFAIWKTGAVFSPINFNYKGKLLSYQINDTKPTVFVTERQYVRLINEITDDIIEDNLYVVMYDPGAEDHDYLPEFAGIALDPQFKELSFDRLLEGNTENLNVELSYWDQANIVYTSGTTGAPKGVVQSYRWMYGYSFYMGKMLTQEDVIYNDLPLYHVGGAFFNVVRAVFAGCMVAVWDKFSPKLFWDRIAVSGATSAVLVDVMTPWLLKAEPKPDDHCNTLNKVHMQPLPKYHQEVAKRFGFDFVTTGFGQTEAGLGFFTIIDELSNETGTQADYYKGYSREDILEMAHRHSIPVPKGSDELNKGYMGRPSVFVETKILNNQDEECAAGEVGQIAFRPRLPHVILTEYFNKPEATLKVFKNLWFHTGDAGYKDEKGDYYFVDRLGTVIRVKGENISSYQVEDIIIGHPGVEMCAVFPIPAEEGDEDDIVAFIILKDQETFNEKEFHMWVEGQMPRYMRPKYIRIVEDIPRTPTNKIEKYKLKESILKELTQNQNVSKSS